VSSSVGLKMSIALMMTSERSSHILSIRRHQSVPQGTSCKRIECGM
jgi:hypothetical protein